MAVSEAQAALLAGKAKRAEGLVANNAFAADAAEITFNASMTADLYWLGNHQLREKTQRDIFKVTIDHLNAEIIQLLKISQQQNYVQK